MDFVAFMIDKENALSLIQSLHESADKCSKDGRRIMEANYTKLADMMMEQYLVSESIHRKRKRNNGDYIG
ncbi:hypothetical protein Syn7803US13_25 [Synechococcus phage ACG-2014f]|jgi:hypothetical protein|uniref:Uncharacterized protein n=5 Tax=Atlauavirus TaxID=2733092 RepID=A0A0E3EV03_9CAUD|nr:hypothetical protein AAJ63_gp025 [Synechococcus phage ACG-2014f]YP_009778179.1 hypothetical protein HOQ61_gp025 [Synechococcus phage ACG-2014f_Syn7803C7]YP_009778466.1 hypothetical protein HOQ62_gp026 [Synechococcus phage ACG-2014f_Syn7803C8]YP_009778752.1 hypothetical protein HOQ63_gp025 [Synechococcus phage ACG-2014f_Syn7803US26]AIX16550.1 hypothetical protein Syn7803C58_25 [Synechococcus phage ACG-2014f]AIX18324.1 hypothetical protein Syn7803C6_25 [Synechococcus phage ACG-2014f]AIX19916